MKQRKIRHWKMKKQITNPSIAVEDEISDALTRSFNQTLAEYAKEHPDFEKYSFKEFSEPENKSILDKIRQDRIEKAKKVVEDRKRARRAGGGGAGIAAQNLALKMVGCVEGFEKGEIKWN